MNHIIRTVLHSSRRFMLLFIAILALTTSCNLQNNMAFPNITYINKSTPQTSSFDKTESSVSKVNGTMRIALPLSLECVQYIYKMYSGDKKGLFNEKDSSLNGLTVTLGELDKYNPDLNLVVQTVSTTGISDQELLTASLSNTLPDIFLVKNSSQFSANSFVPAIFDSSVIDSYLTPSKIFPSMIQSGLDRNSLKSIPYHASTKMVFANQDIIVDAAKTSLLPAEFRLDFSILQSLAKRINKPDIGVFGFMGLSDYLAFYPAAIDTTVGNFMWNGAKFDYSSKAFSKTISYAKSLITSGCVVESLNPNTKKTFYGDADPRTLNKVAFWIDDSNTLGKWNLSSNEKIKRYPIQVENHVTIPLTIYSIVVNSNSKFLSIAESFSTYLALDKNALLFRSRYSKPDGFIPPLKDSVAWENLVKPQKQGDELFSLLDSMNYSKSVTHLEENIVNTIYYAIYEKYLNDVLFGRKNFTTFSEQMTKEANLAVAVK